jgi:hypothetical protein
MGGSMAQVVKHLTSKYSALISNHSTAKYIWTTVWSWAYIQRSINQNKILLPAHPYL